jgi:hypothetical protein
MTSSPVEKQPYTVSCEQKLSWELANNLSEQAVRTHFDMQQVVQLIVGTNLLPQSVCY